MFVEKTKNAEKSTVWNTANNGVPNANGRRRVRDLAIDRHLPSDLRYYLSDPNVFSKEQKDTNFILISQKLEKYNIYDIFMIKF